MNTLSTVYRVQFCKNKYIIRMLGSQKLNLELAVTISRNPVENQRENIIVPSLCVQMPPCPQPAVNSNRTITGIHLLFPRETVSWREVNKKEAIKDLKIYEQLGENKK